MIGLYAYSLTVPSKLTPSLMCRADQRTALLTAFLLLTVTAGQCATGAAAWPNAAPAAVNTAALAAPATTAAAPAAVHRQDQSTSAGTSSDDSDPPGEGLWVLGAALVAAVWVIRQRLR